MNFLLTDRKENKTVKHPALSGIGWCSLIVKEVKIMKKLGILLTAVLIVLAGTNIAFALGWGGGTGGGGTTPPVVIPPINNGGIPSISYSNIEGLDHMIKTESVYTTTNFNSFGIAIGSTSVTTITTEGFDIDNVSISKTITTQTVQAEYKGGNLRTNSVSVVSNTVSGDGSLSSNSYADSYQYDNMGNLMGVTTTGNYYNLEKSTDPTTGVVSDTGASIGTITRTYTIKDGQALMLTSTTTISKYGKDDIIGPDTDANGNLTGIGIVAGAVAESTQISGTSIALGDYVYIGGGWVAKQETEFSEYISSSQYERSAILKQYTRDDSGGVITNMTQSAIFYEQGTKSASGPDVDGNPTEQKTFKNYSSYSATLSVSPDEGWGLYGDGALQVVKVDIAAPQSGWTWTNNILPF
ncbi:MAG: hypothetical protein AABY43_06830 [Candidatus Omnitrophota bacterium]